MSLSPERARWLAEQILPHEPGLRRWLAGRVRALGDVDDIVQEAYAVLAALEDVAHVRDPRAYLYTTARSVILQQLRRARIVSIETVSEIERLESGFDDADPERHAVAGQELRRLADVIRGLPDKCRRVFVLRKVHGLSQREISERLDISESTVEKHIGKGLRILMASMRDECEDMPREPVAARAGRMPGKERHD